MSAGQRFLKQTGIICYSISFLCYRDAYQVNIFAADVVSFRSQILKENRITWVASPGRIEEVKIYPVIYVLDGNSF